MPRAPSLPSASGWHMPAEWHPHAACWMAWPGRTAMPDDAERRAVIACLANIAHAVAQCEPLNVLVDPEHMAQARALLPLSATLYAASVDDHWMRDTGPTLLVNRAGDALQGLSWNFNVWGNKPMPNRGADALLPGHVCSHLNIALAHAPIVTEGGALHVDGAGTLLVSRTSILNENRNPGLTQRDAEDVFRHWLGVRHVVWVPGSSLDTITDGHVDAIACFAQPGVVLATDASADEDWGREARENLRALTLARDAQGRAFEIVRLPVPPIDALARAHAGFDDDDLADFACDYVNFYLANGAVIMPAFGVPATDAAAYAMLMQVFDERRVWQVPIAAIARRGGGIHCCTQQQPRVNAATTG